MVERARLRAAALGFASVAAAVAAALGCRQGDPQVKATKRALAGGLGSRRAIAEASRYLHVPTDYWFWPSEKWRRAAVELPADFEPF